MFWCFPFHASPKRFTGKIPPAERAPRAGGRENGGVGGIRTHGESFPPQPLSRRSVSASSRTTPYPKYIYWNARAHPLPRHVGGGSGIRTHGPFRISGFQDRRLRPLGHPSGCRLVLSLQRITESRGDSKLSLITALCPHMCPVVCPLSTRQYSCDITRTPPDAPLHGAHARPSIERNAGS